MIQNIRNKIKNRSEGFTLVELMIVVAIIGILAAIAIPAFLKNIKSSKASEAQGIMKNMSDGAKSYFTSEQKGCDDTDACDQPWHDGYDAGYPVEWDDYVFPGGDDLQFNTSTGAGDAQKKGDAPTGGAKQTPVELDDNMVVAATNKLNLSLEDPLYFQYAYDTSVGNTGDQAQADITATHNFKSKSDDAHTVSQSITIDSSSQEVQVGPSSVQNEFE